MTRWRNTSGGYVDICHFIARQLGLPLEKVQEGAAGIGGYRFLFEIVAASAGQPSRLN